MEVESLLWLLHISFCCSTVLFLCLHFLLCSNNQYLYTLSNCKHWNYSWTLSCFLHPFESFEGNFVSYAFLFLHMQQVPANFFFTLINMTSPPSPQSVSNLMFLAFYIQCRYNIGFTTSLTVASNMFCSNWLFSVLTEVKLFLVAPAIKAANNCVLFIMTSASL